MGEEVTLHLRRARVPGTGTSTSDYLALLWLRMREAATLAPGPWLIIAAFGFVAWVMLMATATRFAVSQGQLDPRITLSQTLTAAWALWALLPLLGGSSGDADSANSLSPYPVHPRAVFLSSWTVALVDIPYLLAAPAIIALAVAEFGAAGVVASVAFLVGTSAIGQLGGWILVAYVAPGHRLAASVIPIALIGGAAVAAGPALIGGVQEAARVLPPGWLLNLGDAINDGRPAAALGWAAALLSPAFAALVVGGHVARRAIAGEARSAGAKERPWGAITWMAKGSMLRAMFVAQAHTILRATATRVTFAGLLAVPALANWAGEGTVTVAGIAAVTVIGLAGTLGPNSFAFDAGGAVLALTQPVAARHLVAAKVIVLAAVSAAGGVIATLAGAVLLDEWNDIARNTTIVAGYGLALAGLAVVVSVLRPMPADVDALRSKTVPFGSAAIFSLAAAVCVGVVYLASRAEPWALGVLAAWVTGAVVAAMGTVWASRLIEADGGERVAVGVRL